MSITYCHQSNRRSLTTHLGAVREGPAEAASYLWQVNGGQLPPHVVPYCAAAAVLAALLPVAAFFLGRASAKLAEPPALAQAQVRSPSGCAVSSA